MPAVSEVELLLPDFARIDLAYQETFTARAPAGASSIRILLGVAQYFEVPTMISFWYFGDATGGIRSVTFSLGNAEGKVVANFGAFDTQPANANTRYFLGVDTPSAYKLTTSPTTTFIHTPLPLFAMLPGYTFYVNIDNNSAGDHFNNDEVEIVSIRIPSGPTIPDGSQTQPFVTPVLF